MDLLPGFKPTELISIVFGVVSMILAWLSFRRAERSEKQSERAEDRAKRAEERAIQSDERARELTFAQRKGEALALVIDGESALLGARRRLMSVRDKAVEVQADDIATQALTFADGFVSSIEVLHKLRDELNAMKSTGRTHEQLLEFVDAKVSAIRALTDSKIITEQVAVFADPAENHIRLLGVHKEVAAELKRRGLDATDG